MLFTMLFIRLFYLMFLSLAEYSTKRVLLMCVFTNSILEIYSIPFYLVTVISVKSHQSFLILQSNENLPTNHRIRSKG